MELRDDARSGPMRDDPGSAGRNGVMHFGGLHATQHLTECTMQAAQLGLEGSIAVVVVMRRRMLTGMPHRVRNRNLLRKQQEKHADERESTPGHERIWRGCTARWMQFTCVSCHNVARAGALARTPIALRRPSESNGRPAYGRQNRALTPTTADQSAVSWTPLTC